MKSFNQIVLLDLAMPQYDGIFTLQSMKSINSLAKIVLLTGNFSTSMKKEIERYGDVDIIKKPCSLNQLESTLKLIHRKIEVYH